MKLSLCIATYNEEKFIHYPLDSCIDWVDEVIIVDGGSTDNTVKILKSYGKKVKVYVEDNPPMFHINKQKSIERAKGDWILQLDADEEVTAELRNEIQSVISSSLSLRADGLRERSESKDLVAYWIPRKNLFLGRFLTKGGVYPDKTIRLYKNGVATFPCKTVHENVTIDPTVILSGAELIEAKSKDPSLYIGELKNDLLHYADPVFSRYLKRWHRYNDLDVRLLKDANKKVGFIDYVVMKPLVTFLSMYGRHKGFMDGWQGLVFAFFSSIRYMDIYFKFRRRF